MLLVASESLNALLFLQIFFLNELLQAHLILVCFDDVLFHLHHFLLTLKLTNFFTLNVLFDLPFDELALEHLFLNPLNVVQLELFKLVRDRYGVTLALFVLFLELLTHFYVVFCELLFLEITPVLFNFFMDVFLARLESLLGLTLLEHVRMKQSALK